MTITIERGEKVAISRNVTESENQHLLKTMLGKIHPLNGKINVVISSIPSYFEQEVKAGELRRLKIFGMPFLVMDQASSTCST